MQFKQRSVLPGFGLTLGYSLLYLSLIVLIPLAGLLAKTTSLTWAQFCSTVTDPRVVASYKLTFGMSLIAAIINAVFGFLVAWMLVRDQIPGKKLIDAIVDLPFALPTAVSGIALTTLYAPNGWIGRLLAPLGYAPADAPDAADMVILNTCHIREKAAEKLYSDLGRLRGLNEKRTGSLCPM